MPDVATELVQTLTKSEVIDFNRLETIIAENANSILECAANVGKALSEIKEKKYYEKKRPDSDDPVFSTFAEYVKHRYNRGKTMAYHYINVFEVMKYIDDGNLNSNEVGSITNALTISQEVRHMLKEQKVADEDAELFSSRITLLGWRAVTSVAPRDANGRPVITPELVRTVYNTLKDVVSSGSVEVDGQQVPINFVQAGFQNQATEALLEQVNQRKQVLFLESEKTKNKRFGDRRYVPVPISENGASADKRLFKIQCPIHGATIPVSLVQAGFKCYCGCFAIIESVSNDRSQFVQMENPK